MLWQESSEYSIKSYKSSQFSTGLLLMEVTETHHSLPGLTEQQSTMLVVVTETFKATLH